MHNFVVHSNESACIKSGHLGLAKFTNKNHSVYNLMVHTISKRGGCCATKVGYLCAHFVGMRASVKTQVENGLDKFFDLQEQTMNVSDQAVFT